TNLRPPGARPKVRYRFAAATHGVSLVAVVFTRTIRRRSTRTITRQRTTAAGNILEAAMLIAWVAAIVFSGGTFGAVISTRIAVLSNQQKSVDPPQSIARRMQAVNRVQQRRIRFTLDSATVTADTNRRPHRKNRHMGASVIVAPENSKTVRNRR